MMVHQKSWMGYQNHNLVVFSFLPWCFVSQALRVCFSGVESAVFSVHRCFSSTFQHTGWSVFLKPINGHARTQASRLPPWRRDQLNWREWFSFWLKRASRCLKTPACLQSAGSMMKKPLTLLEKIRTKPWPVSFGCRAYRYILLTLLLYFGIYAHRHPRGCF